MVRLFTASSGKTLLVLMRMVLLIFVIYVGYMVCVWLYANYQDKHHAAPSGDDRYFPEFGKVVFNPDEIKLSLVAPQEVAPILEYALAHDKTFVELRPYYAVTADAAKNTILTGLADQRGQLVQGLLAAGGLQAERIHLQASRSTENILPSDPEARRVELTLVEPPPEELKKPDAAMAPESAGAAAAASAAASAPPAINPAK